MAVDLRFYCLNSKDNSEICYNIRSNIEVDISKLGGVLNKTLSAESSFCSDTTVIEIGPLPSFQTSWSTNALSILRDCGLQYITHIEKSRRYLKSTLRDSLKSCGDKSRKSSRDVIKDNINFDPMTEKMWTEGFKFNEIDTCDSVNTISRDKIKEYGEENGLTFDDQDIEYYRNVVFKDRDPTDIELFDLAQSNSEHSRHWYFNAKLRYTDDKTDSDELETLFELVKKPYKRQKTDSNSRIAFSDNASAIEGPTIDHLHHFNIDSKSIESIQVFPTLNAETHNFPTAIAPFSGATTGVGGRIRDTLAVGRGGMMMAGSAGYAVNSLKLLVEASNGASDYGNKIGEPITVGFCRFFDYDKLSTDESDCTRLAYEKPIMFSGGIGQILCKSNLEKKEAKSGMLIVRLGGPAYRIGLGGGTASSRSISAKNIQSDLSAVQRGDPEMENKVNKVLMWCINQLDEENPILSIHDQGAGGMANVTKEIVFPAGADIYLNSVNKGDKSMTPLEVWCSEYQEQISILIDCDDWDLISGVAAAEKCPIECVGELSGEGRIKVYGGGVIPLEPLDVNVYRKDVTPIVDLNLKEVLEHVPQKKYEITRDFPRYTTGMYNELRLSSKTIEEQNCLEYSARGVLKNVLSTTTVGSKRFLVNKVDRSVSGLVAQQQCVGPLQTPVADCTVIANGYFGLDGIASSIGEKPILSINDPKSMVQLTIAEMLTNLAGVPITRFEDIKCSGNWMWPLKDGDVYDSVEGGKLYVAAKELSDIFCELGIAIDGGKDSLSMLKNGIKSPGSLVLSSYVCCTDITKIVTPDLKYIDSDLVYVKLGDPQSFRLGGSIFEEVHSQLFDHPTPAIDNFRIFKELWIWVQSLVKSGSIDSIHDVSDGGLIATISEMCMAGNIGCKIYFSIENIEWQQLWFSEESGLVFECKSAERLLANCPQRLKKHIYIIGKTTNGNCGRKMEILGNEDRTIWCEKLSTLREWWESPSRKCEYLQTNKECVDHEYSVFEKEIRTPILTRKLVESNSVNLVDTLPKNLINHLEEQKLLLSVGGRPCVAILREEGSNGEREMAAVFYKAGFAVFDVPMTRLIDGTFSLSHFQGIVFVGGFSYSDVFGAGQGWAQSILNNPMLKKQFDEFRYTREDTFSLGVCNGCQVMSLLGWVGDCKFLENESGRFESRYCKVKIDNIAADKSIFFKGMQGEELGVWCAHGEGKYAPTKEGNCVEVLKYMNSFGGGNVIYPHNPNGSIRGVAGVCSTDGRHMAMMPHPERSFMDWQLPIESKENNWFRMFQNLYDFCLI